MSEVCEMKMKFEAATKDEIRCENTSVFKIRFKKASRIFADDPTFDNFSKLVGAAINFKNSKEAGNRL